MIARRSLIKGLIVFVAAPAIVKVASLMPVNAALQPGPIDIDEFVRRVMQPMFDRVEQQIADAVIYGNSSGLLRFENTCNA